MKRSRAQRKAELLAEAEVLIESLLDWDARTSKPNHAPTCEEPPMSDPLASFSAPIQTWFRDAFGQRPAVQLRPSRPVLVVTRTASHDEKWLSAEPRAS